MDNDWIVIPEISIILDELDNDRQNNPSEFRVLFDRELRIYLEN